MKNKQKSIAVGQSYAQRDNRVHVRSVPIVSWGEVWYNGGNPDIKMAMGLSEVEGGIRNWIDIGGVCSFVLIRG